MASVNCWTQCSPNQVATLQCLECIFKYILWIVIRAGGLVAFIVIIVGGFRYLTAGEDPKKAQAARNTITYAVLGLVLLIGIWFILKFIEIYTGVKVTEFNIIPTPTP